MVPLVLAAYFWNSATVLRAKTFPMGFEFSGENTLKLMAMDVFSRVTALTKNVDGYLSWLEICLRPGDSYPGR